MTISESIPGRVWHELQIIFFSLVLSLTLAFVFLFVFIPIYLFRMVVAIVGPWVKPELVKILSRRSAIVAFDDLTGVPAYTLLAAVTVERNVDDIAIIRTELMNKIILSSSSRTKGHECKGESDNGIQMSRDDLDYPEFQQYHENWLNFPFWRWDNQFSIENHVSIWPPSESQVMNEIDVARLRLDLVRKPYPKKRGLWEMIIVNNFVPTSEPDKEKKKAVVIFRVHHSVLDGYSLLQVFMTQMMGEKVTQEELRPFVPTPNFYKRHYLTSFLLHSLAVLLIPHTLVRNQFDCADKNPFHVSEKQLTKKVNPASDIVPFKSIQNVREYNGNISFTGTLNGVVFSSACVFLILLILLHIKLKKLTFAATLLTFCCTFTSVILTMLTGGIRNFMLANQMEVPENIHLVMPLPWPKHPSKLRNYWTFCMLKLPVSIEKPLDRLKKCHQNWTQVRMSTQLGINFILVPLVGSLTNEMIKRLVGNRLTTVLLSNFPGPPENAHFFGNPIVDASFGGGLGNGTVGFGVAIISLGQFLRIGIGIDRGILSQPKVQELLNFITKELQLLTEQSIV